MPPKKKAATKAAAPIARHRMGWDRKPAKGKALDDFRTKFAKDMGTPIQERKVSEVDVIPTGSLDLDVALGIGGWRVGRIHEVWGAEHSGKSSLAILSCIEALNKFPDQMVGYIDMEQSFDDKWAESLGLDLSRVLFHTPVTAEDTADAGKRMIMSGMCSLVVIDSIGGMISRVEFEKEADEAVMANVAKIVTRMILQASPIASANGTTILVVNQVRAKIGGYGADTHTAGGWALKHATTSKVQLSGGGDEPRKISFDGDPIPVSKQIAARVQKNKSAPMGYRAKFWLTNIATEKYGPVGVNTYSEAVSVGKKVGAITGVAWLTLPDGHKVQGKDAAEDYLRETPEAMKVLRDQIMVRIRNRSEVDDGPSPEEELAEFIESEEA